MYTIVRREQFSESTFLWDVHAPDVASSAQPGQFVMVRLHDGGERIPLTIADFDREWGTITMVVQAVGKTTKEMLVDYKEGDTFLDFVGPLGAKSHIGNLGHVVLVGGGLGVAPIFPQLRAFKEAGCRTTAIIGFRSKELIFWEEKFGKWCDELIVCTDDGSYGRPGFVTNALADVVKNDRPDLVVAIGPLPMMRACTEVTRPHGVHTVVSLNAIMLDGTGMCGSCRVRVNGDVRFACVDGPDFDAHMVDFTELVARQVRFSKEEKVATEDYSKVCGLEKTLFTDEKRNYKKFKELPPHATAMPERLADERSKNFLEVNLGYRMADALQEAERCIQCLRPSCIEGCPVSIDIPRFIRHLLVRDLPGALSVIQESNLFPSICGRVCPQESQCEAQCILVKKMEPVAIGRLERFVGDHGSLPEKTDGSAVAAESALPAVRIGRVAVVGSGPAGLACAGDLARKGVEVTVFEALHVIGGVLRYGIPAFRLPREIIDREVAALAKMGVTFQLNKVIGKTFTVKDLLGKMGYDAIFVGTGAGAPSFLGIPGEFAGQVYSANEFLTRVNLMGGDRFPYEDTPVTFGKRVVVIGAGNTAMDCLRVAKRLGALEVRCVYRRTEAEAPARIEELRHAKEEGITFHWLRGPIEIRTGESGSVESLACQVMELGEPDKSGRRRPVPVAGVTETFECDTVIYALGTQANPIIARSTPGLDTRGEGYINVDARTQAANLPGVFAGGDIVTGAATVILALGAGRRAARAIETYLKTREWPPQVVDALPAAASARLEPQVPGCPRCGVPLAEGEEETICCAGRQLIWTCTSCWDVSEGFAFPFGLCPLCGGTLRLGHDSVGDGDEAIKAVREAYEIELGGVAFYERGMRDARNPEVAELFGRLGAMEREHMRTLSRRYHIDEPDADVPYVSPARIAIYTGLEGRLETPADLLRLAVHLENRARHFFLETGRKFDPSSLEWRLYRELEAEEREHAEMLATALQNLEAERPIFV
ncbi:MAG: NADPH-dependent glutamate synthase [Thermoanaerobaculia bacterium]